jgi:hypothetical protein
MNVRLKYDLHFTAGFYSGKQLRMSNYSLRLWLATNTQHASEQNIAFERMKYFVYHQIDNTIFIDESDHDQCVKFVEAGLDITTMPGEPVDQLIGIMLFYKLNAIMENRLIVLETELSSNYGENMVYLHCEEEETLNIATPAWWRTADPIHSDVDMFKSEKVVAMQSGPAWRDLDLAWPDMSSQDAHGNIVVFADFKPTNETKQV